MPGNFHERLKRLEQAAQRIGPTEIPASDPPPPEWRAEFARRFTATMHGHCAGRQAWIDGLRGMLKGKTS